MSDLAELLECAKRELEERRLEIEHLRASLDRLAGSRDRRIAVVGSAVRLPGTISTAEDLWRSLLAAEVHAKPISEHRCYAGTDFWRRAESHTSRLALIDDPWGFDHRFFRLSPRELRQMDPQQRLLLEMAWEALESAAICPTDLGPGRRGVFIGISSDDFQRLNRATCAAESLDAYAGTGAHRSMAAGRVAAFLGWNGPAIQLDTACSSSLVAIYLACQALRNGEIDVALAGGCHLIFDPVSVVERGVLGALAPDGRCKPFESAADGFGMGEGGALVVLRAYDEAVRDGDPIIGVIDGIAVNHNGAGAGITAPNPAAQIAVMEAALRDADARPDDVVFLETHGTGTKLGDPIEVNAIETVYARRSNKLPLGSIKANFGHLEAAAGIVSLMKAMLVNRNGLIPPTPSQSADSDFIPWQSMACHVPRWTQPIAHHGATTRVAVSSFGMSGTNCHAVLSAAPIPVDADEMQCGPIPIVIGAVDAAALAAIGARLADRLDRAPLSLAGVARTLATGRAHLAHRVAFAAASRAELREGLRYVAQGTAPPGGFSGQVISGRRGRGYFAPDARIDPAWIGLLRDVYASLLANPAVLPSIETDKSGQLGDRVLQGHALSMAFWRHVINDLRESAPRRESSDGDGSTMDDDWVSLPVNFAFASLQVPDAAEQAAESAIRQTIASTLAALFCINAPVVWDALSFARGQRFALPTYPFQRRVHTARPSWETVDVADHKCRATL